MPAPPPIVVQAEARPAGGGVLVWAKWTLLVLLLSWVTVRVMGDA